MPINAILAPCKRIHEGPGFRIPASRFQPFGFRFPTFWIPDSIPKWRSRIPKPLWFPDSGFSYMGRQYLQGTLCDWTLDTGLIFNKDKEHRRNQDLPKSQKLEFRILHLYDTRAILALHILPRTSTGLALPAWLLHSSIQTERYKYRLSDEAKKALFVSLFWEGLLNNASRYNECPFCNRPSWLDQKPVQLGLVDFHFVFVIIVHIKYEDKHDMYN